jgi:DNA (cytosine-5)-methyltransferase 1
VTVPKLLDLYCCQGGAGEGYRRAGFDVIGVDLNPQPRYPFEFHQADALQFLAEHHHEFDAFHASPPCQDWSVTKSIHAGDHGTAWLLDATRTAFIQIGKPWVIENVPGAAMFDPIVLCGTMFGLEVYRHRLFESSEALVAPSHPKHVAKATQVGRQPKPGEFMTVAGHFANVQRARECMGIDWMNRDGLAQSIPPAYSEYVGKQLLAQITSAELEETYEEAS